MQVVVFKIGKEEYGVDIQRVQEIVLDQKRTKLPNFAEYMEGVINLRGIIIPVLNLAIKFNLVAGEDAKSTRLIVLNLEDDKKIAIIADEVTEVLTITEQEIENIDNFTQTTNKHCISGIAKLKDKLVILLEVGSIVDAEELPKIDLELLESKTAK
ncbi:MAG: hypothetical protein VR72_14350 [Clostridiaceae bacterium BRH_c20a]|nr:MAG: hypothetical protein VR72_14350 [Clostridiaceae bacterium BRH_c20a]